MHGIAAIEEVVCGEILEQIAEHALHQEGDDDRNRDVALGVLGFTFHGSDRFKSHQDQDGHRGLDEGPSNFVDSHHGGGLSVRQEIAAGVIVGVGDEVWYGLSGGIQLRLRDIVGVADNRLLPVGDAFGGGKFIGITSPEVGSNWKAWLPGG